MVILGIDPGSINLGYSLVEKKNSKINLLEAGVIKIKKALMCDQIANMNEELDKIFDNFDIDEVAIESIFYANSPKTTIKLAEFRGAILLKIVQKKRVFFEYTPLQIKKAVTGNGKSTKEQVNFMVKRIFGIKTEIKPYDISDAMAISVIHSQRV